MANITVTAASKELFESIVLKEFNDIDFNFDYVYGKSRRLINMCREYGENELADQLELDERI